MENIALAYSNLLYMVNSLPDIVYLLDPDGIIVNINKTVENYGYTQSDLLGKSILDLVDIKEKEDLIYCLQERRTGKRGSNNIELKIKTKNNITKSFEILSNDVKFDSLFLLSSSGIYNNQDNLIFEGTIGIARDITEKKILQNTINDKNEKINILEEIIPICCNCKNVRDDHGFWDKVETYISKFTRAEFTHGICPECMEKLNSKYYN